MILLDTTILVYAVGADHSLRDPCSQLLERVANGSIRATTTLEAIQEFTDIRAIASNASGRCSTRSQLRRGAESIGSTRIGRSARGSGPVPTHHVAGLVRCSPGSDGATPRLVSCLGRSRLCAYHRPRAPESCIGLLSRHRPSGADDAGPAPYRSSLMRTRLPAGSRIAQSRTPYGCSVGSWTISASPGLEPRKGAVEVGRWQG